MSGATFSKLLRKS